MASLSSIRDHIFSFLSLRKHTVEQQNQNTLDPASSPARVTEHYQTNQADSNSQDSYYKTSRREGDMYPAKGMYNSLFSSEPANLGSSTPSTPIRSHRKRKFISEHSDISPYSSDDAYTNLDGPMLVDDSPNPAKRLRLYTRSRGFGRKMHNGHFVFDDETLLNGGEPLSSLSLEPDSTMWDSQQVLEHRGLELQPQRESAPSPEELNISIPPKFDRNSSRFGIDQVEGEEDSADGEDTGDNEESSSDSDSDSSSDSDSDSDSDSVSSLASTISEVQSDPEMIYEDEEESESDMLESEGEDVASPQEDSSDEEYNQQSESEFDVSESDMSESEDEVVARPRQPSTPRRESSPTLEPYRPSPKVVDRNLSNYIVARDAEESDLSEDEVLPQKEEKKQVKGKQGRKDFVLHDIEMEAARMRADSVRPPPGHWSEPEKDLYWRIKRRGFEPLVPGSWKLDFDALHEDMYAWGTTPAYISSLYGREFHAIKYLRDLFALGNNVRGRLLTRLRPSLVIHRIVRAYIKWALQDANLHNRPDAIPIHIIYSRNPSQDTQDAVQNVKNRLIKLANRYRDAWSLKPSAGTYFNGSGLECIKNYEARTFPVLVGFLICGPIVGIFTLDSNPEMYPVLEEWDEPFRYHGKFDFSDPSQDVWNALAVAIAVIRMRKTMLQLAEEGQGEIMWAAEHSMGVDDDDMDL
ncbi:hypothetical protein AJ80_01389 [Polytolypa hystricis UAMH7299]|uniref:Uncharacterized protein n=1 Tax=Polytolypa hystricis (strain UAMH7299) TaxID=1447883 RepID=A0A2B7Z083_POLH7|nr:hypothetical protein AJ80_01389 [Polytolypa hystricis UAMH7299]